MPSGRIAYNKKTVFAINNFRIAKTVYLLKSWYRIIY